MNWINRSEKVFGEPAPNDDKHPRAGKQAKEYSAGTYEASVQRGIYTSMQWSKALSYASPYARLPAQVVAQIVLLVRVPGSLEKVGVTVEVGSPKQNLVFGNRTWRGRHIIWIAIGLPSTWRRPLQR